MTSINVFGITSDDWFSSTIDTALSTTLATSLLAQAGAGFRWCITDITVGSISNTVDSVIKILGNGTRVAWTTGSTRTTGGVTTMSFSTPVKLLENEHCYIQASAASSSAYVSISGYKERV